MSGLLRSRNCAVASVTRLHGRAQPLPGLCRTIDAVVEPELRQHARRSSICIRDANRSPQRAQMAPSSRAPWS